MPVSNPHIKVDGEGVCDKGCIGKYFGQQYHDKNLYRRLEEKKKSKYNIISIITYADK